ncbi:MAG: DUF393 domain-containing protein [Armatimonadetes bacterium]|nr:DUF393 domain-containing protein [Akkermansiaceae bacterium]
MRWVLFFDGECGFCNQSVRQVHRFDRRGEVDFAPLQGELGKSLGLEKYAVKGGGTMVLMREGDGAMFYKSDAWVKLGMAMGGMWKILAMMLAVVPVGLRDWAYDGVARNRYRLAGVVGTCGLPDQALRNKMRA